MANKHLKRCLSPAFEEAGKMAGGGHRTAGRTWAFAPVQQGTLVRLRRRGLSAGAETAAQGLQDDQQTLPM